MKKYLALLIITTISTLELRAYVIPQLPPTDDNYDYPTILRTSAGSDAFMDNATITAIHKDQRGFMWFATDRGLHCYDGISERTFKSPHYGQVVSGIRETDDEIFFLLDSHEGLRAFDRRTESYIPVEFNNQPDRIEGYYFELTPAGLYAAGERGLFKVNYNVKGGAGEKYIDATAEKISNLTGPFKLLAVDNKGVLYTTIPGSHDLISYNTQDGVAHRIPIDLGQHFPVKQITHLFAFDDLIWYTAFPNTLVCYDLAQKRYFAIKNSADYSFNEIRDIVKASDKTYFFATWNGGMRLSFDDKPDPEKYTLLRSPFNHDTRGNFIESRSIAMYCDTTRRILWVGTFGGGVVKYTNLLNSQVLVPDVSIYQVTEDKKGYIWISTDKGIMRSTLPTLARATKFAPYPKHNLKGERLKIYNDQDQYLWFTDHSGNILRLDQYTGEALAKSLTLDGKTPYTERINDITRDSKNNIWIATRIGLLKSDTELNKFELITIDNIPPTRITQVLEDREGVIWIGTIRGLHRLTPTASGMTARGGYEKQIGSHPSIVYVLATNSRGDIIASYSDKIIRIGSLDKERVGAIFSLEDGTLPSGHIFKILDDKFGNTWFGNNTRIMNTRSAGDQISIFSMADNSIDGWRLQDGRLLWTSSWGLMFFTPQDITKETIASRILLARIKIDNQDIKVGQKINGQTILKKNIDLTDTIILKAENANLELFFSDLSFTDFQKRISYKLDPLSDKWTTHAIDEPLRFAALNPGTYTLTIRPQINGEASKFERTLTIIVKQKWYRSGVFVIFVVILMSISVLKIYKWVLRLWGRVKLRQADGLLAVLKEHEEAAVKTVESPLINQAATRKMLIIGNEKNTIETITQMFSEEFEIVLSRDSAAALIDSLYHMPHLIMMLMDMPEALECCRKIKSSTRTCAIPMVMIDSQDDPKRRVAAVIAQADDYIVLEEATENGYSLLRRVVENRMAGHEAIHQVYSRMVKQKQMAEGGGTEQAPDQAVYEFFTELSATIVKNMKDPNFSAKRLAELMNMSQSTLYRRVMSGSGHTIIETIRDVRLRRASELLYQGGMSIQMISEEVGYQDIATFRKHFVDLYGMNPSQFGK